MLAESIPTLSRHTFCVAPAPRVPRLVDMQFAIEHERKPGEIFSSRLYQLANVRSVSFEKLLTVFFATHDATSLNRQGNDIGTQYRSAIYYTNESQRLPATQFIEALNASTPEGKPIVTEVVSLAAFYPAEEYHTSYYARNQNQGYCSFVIAPKLAKAKKMFSELMSSPDTQKE